MMMRKIDLCKSTTPLAENEVFTWDSTDFSDGLGNVRRIFGYVVADQASAASGFTIKQSGDGTNWDVESASTALVANTVTDFDIKIVAKHVQISLTNGAVAQTSLRLYVMADEFYGGSL